MSNQNQKHEQQPEQKTIEQPTTPAQLVELSDEELGQVVGGALTVNAIQWSGSGGAGDRFIQPDPTAVE